MLSINIFQSSNFSLTVFWSKLKRIFSSIVPLLEMHLSPDLRFFSNKHLLTIYYELGTEERDDKNNIPAIEELTV